MEIDDTYVTVMLKWNDRTPEDYEPRGFSPANYMFKIHEECTGVRAGKVKTRYHSLKAKIRAWELENDWESTQGSQKTKGVDNLSQETQGEETHPREEEAAAMDKGVEENKEGTRFTKAQSVNDR